MRHFAAVPLLAVLAGCGSSPTLTDQFGTSMWVTPGKYAYHDCKQAQGIDRGYANRQKELEELMARAAQGTGGQVIGQMVYRTEYQQVVGERQQLAKALVDKQCYIESPRSSERTVF
jgi:hypothetical protein